MISIRLNVLLDFWLDHSINEFDSIWIKHVHNISPEYTLYQWNCIYETKAAWEKCSIVSGPFS